MEGTNYKKLLQLECDKFFRQELKDFALYCLGKVPSHFWTKPASSSGKYHFPDENGEGGLALHILRVCKVVDILLKAKNTVDLDAVRFACIFHDVGRYGLKEKPEKWSLKEHPELGVKFLEDCISTYNWPIEIVEGMMGSGMSLTGVELTYKIVQLSKIKNAILTHMGRWGTVKPETEEDWIVHLADMIASQYKP